MGFAMNPDYFHDPSEDYVFFLPNFHVGGAEKFLIQVANNLVSKGFSVYVVVARNTGVLGSTLDSRIRVTDLNVTRVGFSLFRLLNFLSGVKTPHLVTTMYHCNLIGCFAKLIKPRIKLTIRESTSVDFYFKYSSAFKAHILFFFFWIFYRFSDDAIFPSQEMLLRFLKQTGLGSRLKARVVPNTIDVESVTAQSKEPIEPQVWSRTHSKVIINVGRLDLNKNQQLILRALALLPDKDVEFVQVGDGEELINLKSLSIALGLEGRVHFVGYQRNPFKFLKAADIFVLSSLVEGYPNALVQAKFFGLDIISLDCPTGPAEILKDYSKGTLIDLGQAHIERVLADKLRDLC